MSHKVARGSLASPVTLTQAVCSTPSRGEAAQESEFVHSTRIQVAAGKRVLRTQPRPGNLLSPQVAAPSPACSPRAPRCSLTWRRGPGGRACCRPARSRPRCCPRLTRAGNMTAVQPSPYKVKMRPGEAASRGRSEPLPGRLSPAAAKDGASSGPSQHFSFLKKITITLRFRLGVPFCFQLHYSPTPPPP